MRLNFFNLDDGFWQRLPAAVFVSLCFFAIYALFRHEPWALPGKIPDFDKLAHFALFLLLSCSSYFAFVSLHPLVYQLPLLLFAGSSEWFQAVFSPHRRFSLGDVEANLLGVFLGFLFCLMCWHRMRYKQN